MVRIALSALAILVALIASPAEGEAQCNRCFECYGGEHENDYFGTYGDNIESAHPCWAYSCTYMRANGVHLPRRECEGGDGPGEPTPHDLVLTIQSLEDITPVVASDLLAEFPGVVVTNEELDFLQVLDCKREYVIAQFAIAQGDGD